MRFNRRSLRFTLRPVHFPLYWQWVLIIFKPPLFTFSPFTWCLICTFLYHISHDCGSISHTKPKTMDDPTSLVSLDNSCGAGWLSAHSSYYSPRSRGRRGTVEMADLTEYFRFDWIFSGAVLEICDTSISWVISTIQSNHAHQPDAPTQNTIQQFIISTLIHNLSINNLCLTWKGKPPRNLNDHQRSYTNYSYWSCLL